MKLHRSALKTANRCSRFAILAALFCYCFSAGGARAQEQLDDIDITAPRDFIAEEFYLTSRERGYLGVADYDQYFDNLIRDANTFYLVFLISNEPTSNDDRIGSFLLFASSFCTAQKRRCDAVVSAAIREINKVIRPGIPQKSAAEVIAYASSVNYLARRTFAMYKRSMEPFRRQLLTEIVSGYVDRGVLSIGPLGVPTEDINAIRSAVNSDMARLLGQTGAFRLTP